MWRDADSDDECLLYTRTNAVIGISQNTIMKVFRMFHVELSMCELAQKKRERERVHSHHLSINDMLK